MNLQYATTDASIILPNVNIPPGATYIIGNPNGNTNLAMMVASQDSTTISITPISATSTGKPAGVPYTVKLKKGELYQIKGANLTGSIIRVVSNTKVAVFSGDACSNFPCGACDHQYEQVMPNQLTDTAYYAPPHFGHTSGYYLKIVPVDSNISIKVNNTTYSNLSRLTPITINVKGDSGYYIRSNKLFHVFQFLKGASGCNGYINSSYGDPAMLELLSNKYMGQRALFSTVNSSNLRDHFVSIVINTVEKNNVYLDKTKIDSSEFKPFPYDNKRSYAYLKINLGTHLIECSGGMLAYCYGVGYYESYLYLAGFNLPNFDLDFKDSVVQYDCKNKKIKMQFRPLVSKTLKSYTWYFGDNTTGTGNPVTHLYNSTGMFTVKLVGEDFSGKKDSVTRQVKVDWPSFDPVRNKIICGIDTVKFEERNPFFANFKWQDSSTNNYFKVWDNANVWVFATDTSGYCKFVDSGVVGKINIFSSLRVDSLEKCFKYNLFKFTDSTKIFADQIEHKAWVFPFGTYWDQNSINVKFPMPGKYKVYFDVYTKQVNCKARYPIDVVVHPMPKPYTNFNGDDFCSGTKITFKDSSQIVTGNIKQVQWDFDDNTTVISDSGKTQKTIMFDPTSVAVTRKYKQIPISNFGCRDTIESAVSVWPKPDVNFTINTADTIKCLPAARWTYNSNTKTYFDTFSLKWDAGNGVKGTSKDLRNVRYNAPGIYKVKLVGIDQSFGCKDSIIKTVEVLPLPIARFNIVDSQQCFAGHSFAFKDSSTGKYLTYNWSTISQTDTGKQVDSFTFSAPGDYDVKLVVNSQYASCVDSTIKKVHVLEPPTAAFTSNKDTQCLNNHKFVLSNTSNFLRQYKESLWQFVADTSNTSDTNFNIANKTFADTGSIKVTLIVKDIELCSDTFVKYIRVAAHTKSALSINDTTQCFNGNRFVFRTTIPNGESRNWKLNNVLVQSGTIDSLVRSITTAGKHKIVITGTNALGCGDSTFASVRVLDKPITAFTINNDTQCFVGHAFNINNTSTANNDVINTYKYIVDDTFKVSTPNITGLKFAAVGRYKAKLKIITQELCVDSTEQFVTVLSNPNARIVGDTVCIGEPSLISAIQTSGNPITTWNWNLGDGNNGNVQSFNHTYNNIGNFNNSLTITDQYNCSAVITSNGIQVVHPLPNANFSFDAIDYGINQSKVLIQPIEMGALKYDWKFPNGSNSNKDTPSIIINDLLKGKIYFKITNQFGCVDSSDRDIYVYPNNFNVFIPSAFSINQDLLNDEFKPVGLGATRDYKMSIFNRWGEEIFTTTDPSKGWDGTYQNDFVMEGVYSYLIEFKFIDGKAYKYTGTLTVLR